MGTSTLHCAGQQCKQNMGPASAIDCNSNKDCECGWKKGGRGYGMKIWLFNGVGWMVNPDNVHVLAFTHWRLVVRTLYVWGRRMISMQSLVTFLINIFNCLVLLKDPAEVLMG